MFIEDSLIKLFKAIESYETTTFGCKKSTTTPLCATAWTLFFSGKCSTPTSASLRHHGLLSIFSRNIEKKKTCPNSFARQHSSAKNPFPTIFSRHCVTDAFWMHGFSDPNGFREKTILLRYQDSMCYFQEPHWNWTLQPPEVFFQESKPAPPEPFFRNRNRNRNCPFLSSITETNRSTPKP